MKKAYLVCDNHMDLIWRRCFENHFYYRGNVVRPYAQIEEALFDRWIEIIKDSDCKYSVEQSLTIKKYLERNPDKFELFKQLVNDGKIELLGAGETIIDYNMVQGESIVRNHMYSILWYKDNFGIRPSVGCATDTFGLNAQIPQIYRKFGYNNLVIYSRVFKNAKSYFRGLSGDIVYFKTDYEEAPRIQCADFRKYRACKACHGEGCNLCGYTGLDYSYKIGLEEDFKLSAPATTLESCFAKMKESEAESFLFQVTTEEAQENAKFTVILSELGEKYGVDVIYTTYEGLIKQFGQEYIDKLKENRIAVDEIDERIEGNVVSTGCYVSRVKIKQQNRELEDLLVSCEKFATFAADFGMIYPAKKIERLWSKMALIQFHDSITATHIDAGYAEIMTLIREVRLGAGQIYTEAMKTIEKNINVPERSGYQSFVLFNPLSWEVKDSIFEASLSCEQDDDEGIIIEDENGVAMKVMDIKVYNNDANKAMSVKFTGAAIPPVGFKVFYYKFKKASEVLTQSDANIIENEYYRIELDKYGVKCVFDKELGENILTQAAGSLVAEEDYGSPWETLATPYFKDIIHKESGVEISVQESDQQKTILLKGLYTNPRRKIEKIDWTQTITLYGGIKKIYFKTEVDWDTVNSRLMVSFPLSFRTKDDEAYYEIPYGILKRKAYKPYYGMHSDGNGDWPAINFMSVVNEEKNYTVTLINKGLVANQVRNGVMYLSLLRSPDVPVYIYDFEGAKDKGRHSFEYCVTSSKGGLKEGKVVRQGLEFNTSFATCAALPKAAALAPTHSFLNNENENVIISAIKRAQKGSKKVLRLYEAYGEASTDLINGGRIQLYESDFLEEEETPVSEIKLSGFEIKTYKI